MVNIQQQQQKFHNVGFTTHSAQRKPPCALLSHQDKGIPLNRANSADLDRPRCSSMLDFDQSRWRSLTSTVRRSGRSATSHKTSFQKGPVHINLPRSLSATDIHRLSFNYPSSAISRLTLYCIGFVCANKTIQQNKTKQNNTVVCACALFQFFLYKFD